ncbi:hypothetical protein NMY22_g8247 [Coprinellus aureogranulatus]|nr:hypothetical protein NMY22_g8247 [Coprinellus aureogranulatus]
MFPNNPRDIFFAQGHLLLIVFQTLPWMSLLRARHLPNREAYGLVKTEIRERVYGRLDRFVPSSLAPKFFHRLKSSKGLMIGGVVREALLHNHEKAPTPTSTLTIAVAQGCESHMQEFVVEDLGYTLVPWNNATPLLELRTDPEAVDEEERYRKEDGGKEHFIVIMISKEQALRVLIAADNTADMLAISHDTIVSYYPRLLFAGEGMFNNTAVEPDDTSGMSITADGVDIELHANNYHWTKPCGPYCPEIWRWTYDDAGVMKIRWDGVNGYKDIKKEKRKDGSGEESVGSGEHVSGSGSVEQVSGPDERVGGSTDNRRWSVRAQDAEDGEECSAASDGVPVMQYHESETALDSAATGWTHSGGWLEEEAQTPKVPQASQWTAVGTNETWGFEWGGIAFWNHRNTGSDFTYSEILQWRITNCCRNPHCRNSRLHEQRSHYVKMYNGTLKMVGGLIQHEAHIQSITALLKEAVERERFAAQLQCELLDRHNRIQQLQGAIQRVNIRMITVEEKVILAAAEKDFWESHSSDRL